MWHVDSRYPLENMNALQRMYFSVTFATFGRAIANIVTFSSWPKGETKK